MYKLILLQLITGVITEVKSECDKNNKECQEMEKLLQLTQQYNAEQREQLDITRQKLAETKKKSCWEKFTDYMSLQQYGYSDGMSKEIIITPFKKNTYLDRAEYGGLNYVRIVKGKLFWKYILIIDWTNPGWDVTMRFVDEVGASHSIWLVRTGIHFLNYNSLNPAILKIEW